MDGGWKIEAKKCCSSLLTFCLVSIENDSGNKNVDFSEGACLLERDAGHRSINQDNEGQVEPNCEGMTWQGG